jgi:hypothetical protein
VWFFLEHRIYLILSDRYLENTIFETSGSKMVAENKKEVLA